MQQVASNDAPNASRPLAPSARGLFSRITSPFGAKGRTVVEFVVQADDPHRRYSPGDLVTGHVLLKLAKAIRVTHIVVCLHGFVQVFKTPGVPPPDGFRTHNSFTGKRRGSRRGEYFGNGFATLFEDEQVICGEGRLEEGNYKFGFEARFPSETLPSSIEFERGAVTYMVTATMTRPTSITPVVFHDQKITFAERIDIAKLLPPRARTISLEPLVKRSQGKSPTIKRQISASNTIRQEEASISSPPRSLAGTNRTTNPQRSTSPSAPSVASQRSSDPLQSSAGSVVRSSRNSECGSAAVPSLAPSPAKPRIITVTVESLRGGTLPGETIPLRIAISHSKHVKSMQGVVVTLYRQARVDTHPALPVGPTTSGEKRRFEDYYPKSMTGLGGLSLSGAGSSHVFRKDLSQIDLPLIVHPGTFTAELTPKLRVPEDAFPTIACVPGAMISFKYYLEVIIDIQGKLSGTDRYTTGIERNAADGASGFGGDQSAYPSGGKKPYIDTTAMRREQNVVACVLEIVIGTVDTERKKEKQRVIEDVPTINAVQERQPESSQGPGEHWNYNHQQAWDERAEYYPSQGYYDGYHEGYYDETYHDQQYWGPYHEAEEALQYEPPPRAFDEELPEKERLRRAEANLLPSEAPSDGPEGEASAPVGALVPHVPDLGEEQVEETLAEPVPAPVPAPAYASP